jgi:WD40 repeat protein
MKVFRIFLSSTAKDLHEYRDKIMEAISDLDQKAVHMESFGARPGDPLNECRKLASEADALIVVVAHRYGWIPSLEQGGDDITSITWHEVIAALEQNKPVFAFLVDPHFTWPYATEQDRLKDAKSQQEAAGVWQAVQKLDEFKKFLADKVVCAPFDKPDDLKSKIATSISRWLLRELQSGRRQAESRPQRQEIINFNLERQRHRPFVGREDVFSRLDSWLLSQTGESWVLISGGPGTGKSAILSNYVERLEKEGLDVAVHFLRRQVSDWARPETIVRSLSAQVEMMFPECAEPDNVTETRLIELIARVSATRLVPQNKRLYLVVDGLDEAEPSEVGSNPLPQFLPYTLPDNVFLLCASRPTYPHLSWLEGRRNLRTIDLNHQDWTQSNWKACRAFWLSQDFDPPLNDTFIDEAVVRGAGNLLHSISLCDWLKQQPPSERRVELIPRGLSALMDDLIWRELSNLGQTDFALAKKGLGVLCAAREALPLSELGALLGGQDDNTVEFFLKSTRAFLLVQPAHWEGEVTFRLFHESFREFLVQKFGRETIRRFHILIASTIAVWPPDNSASAFRWRYAIRHALFHHAKACDWTSLTRTISNIGYLESMCVDAGLDYLQAELRAQVLGSEAMPEIMETPTPVYLSPDEREARRNINDFLQVIRRESHHLRAWDPEQKPAYFAQQLFYRAQAMEISALATAAEKRLQDIGASFFSLRWQATRYSPELVQIAEVGNAVRAIAATADGQHVVSLSFENKVQVWELTTGEPIAILEIDAVDPERNSSTTHSYPDKLPQTVQPNAGVHDKGSNAHFTEGQSSNNDIRDPSDAWEDEIDLPEDYDDYNEITALACHSSANQVAIGTKRGEVTVWDWRNDQIACTIKAHTAPVAALAFTTEGHLVSGSSTVPFANYEDDFWDWEGESRGTLKTWDLSQYKQVNEFSGHAEGIASISATNDGNFVSASWGEEDGKSCGTVRLWDAKTGKELRCFSCNDEGYVDCDIASNGDLIIARTSHQTLRVWERDSGNLVKTIKIVEDEQNEWGSPRDPIAAKHNDEIVFVGNGANIECFDLRSGKHIRHLVGHREGICEAGSSKVTALTLLESKTHLISAGIDGLYILWNTSGDATISTSLAHQTRIKALGFSTDGINAVSVSEDGLFKKWQLDDKSKTKQFQVELNFLDSVALFDGARLAIMASDVLTLLDTSSSEVLGTMEGNSKQVNFDSSWGKGGGINSVKATEDGKVFAYAYYPDGLAHLSLIREKESLTIRTPYNIIADPVFDSLNLSSIAFTRDLAKCFHPLGIGKTLLEHTLIDGDERVEFSDHEKQVTAVAINPTGGQVASAASKEVKVRDIEKGGVRSLAVSDDWKEICQLTFSTDCKKIVAGMKERSFGYWDGPLDVCVWDIATGAKTLSLQNAQLKMIEKDGAITARYAVSWTEDSSAVIWDLEKGVRVSQQGGISVGTDALVISENGTYAVSISGPQDLKVWDVTNGELRYQLNHKRDVSIVRLAGKNMMVSGTEDGTIFIWDLDKGELIRKVKHHAQKIAAIAFQSKGTVMSASTDGRTVIWQMSDGKILAEYELNAPIVGLRVYKDLLLFVSKPDDYEIMVATRRGRDADREQATKLKVFDETGEIKYESPGIANGEPLVLCLTPDGRYSVWSNKTGLSVTDLSTGAEKRLFENGEERLAVIAVEASPDSRSLLITCNNGALYEWYLGTEEEPRKLDTRDSASILAVVFGKDGRSALTGDSDHHITALSLPSGRQKATVGLDASIECIAMSPNDQCCLVGDRLGNVYCFNLANLLVDAI